MSTVDEEPDMELRKPEAGDLNYYAKPENYQGTRDSMRRFLTTHRPGQDKSPAVEEPTGSSPDRKGPPSEADPSRKAPPVTGVWTYNRGTFDRVMPIPRPAATYVRRIMVKADDDDRTETEFAEVTQGDKQQSMAVTGLGEEGPRGADAPGSRQSSVALEGSGKESLQSKLIARKKARDRIRRAIKIVLINLRWITLIEKQENKTEHNDPTAAQKTFTDIASEVANSDDGFPFDLSYFKAKRELPVPNEIRQILTTPFALRTPQQIQTAVYGLKHLESFAEYPQHMREKLCQIGWFQQVPPKRVIIRQGQPPENFYFILSGQAVVRFLDQNEATGENQLRTAAMLRRGSSFGELALLHHTRRTATVVSQGVVQLLTIGKEDFFRIIMGLLPDGSVPAHIRFLSTLDFMQDWPTDVLANYPDKCMFLYFKRGTVMVRDSNESDWIYVVKSGSCQVIKKLVSVAPRTLHQRKSQAEQRKFPPELNASIAFSNIVKTSTRKISQVEARNTNHDYIQSPSSDLQSPDGAEKRSRRWSYAGIPSSAVPPSEEQVFVQVETLLPKDVFGLRNINFETDFEPTTGVAASVSLVSNGAECVMLSKKCFIENANASVRHRVRTQVRPYPSDQVLQDNLQRQVDWKAYKQHLIQFCTKTRSARHSRVRVGQASFPNMERGEQGASK